MKKLTLLSLLLILACTAVPVQAQFQGTITFRNFDVEGGEQTERDPFTLFLTADRILLQGNSTYELMGPIEAKGILIRLDQEDFVFLNGEKSALTISKNDISSLMNMFGSGQQSGGQSGVSYEKTGDTREIMGHSAELFEVRGEEGDSYSHVWMTSDIEINWGMLAEPWGESVETMVDGEFPLGAIFREGYFPLRVEYFSGGEQRSITEVSQINASPVSPALVQIPEGIQVLSLQDFLFQRMSRQ